MKKNILFILLLSSLLSIQSFAQPTNNLINDVVMPPPNAAALGTYGDIPVSYNTGIPNVGIPIYTVTEGNLSLPISLSYHAGGVRMGEPASWVGTGWSLNAGGVITRTILGLPDEKGNGYYTNGSTLDYNDDNDVEDVAKGELDGEPDLFSFNVGGYTGKFLIDENNEVFLMPKQDLKVEWAYTTSRFIRFIITAPDGTRYIFGNQESSTAYQGIESTFTGPVSGGVFSNGTSAESNNSSWYLVRVESADKKHYIDLSYVEENYGYKSLASATLVRRNYYCTSTEEDDGDLFPTIETINGRLYSDNQTRYNENSVNGRRLSQITTSSGTQTIDFVPHTSTRIDLENTFVSYTPILGSTNSAYRLAYIKISSGTFCSRWELDYSHFENTNPAPEKYRLKLDQVRQIECNTTTQLIPPYVFTYLGPTNANSTKFLPSILSKAIDHWGYYNGATFNQSEKFNIPTTSLSYGGQTYTRGGSFRESVESEMVVGTLNSIKYPTGGLTSFEYEVNTAPDDFSGTYELMYLENCESFKEACCGAPDQSQSIYFQDATQISNVKFDLFLTANNGYFCEPGACASDCFTCQCTGLHEVTVSAWDVENNVSMGDVTFNVTTGASGTTNNYNLSNLSSNFVAGRKYRFTLDVDNGRGSFRLYAQYDQTVTYNRPVGGLRVKKVTSSPSGSIDLSADSKDIIRNYEYKDATDTTLSSGILKSEPVYGTSGTFPINGGVGTVSYYTIQSFSITPMGSFNGGHVGYERVIEKFNGIGKTIYNYKVDNALQILSIPTPPNIYRAPDGELLSSETFTEGNTKITGITNTPKTASFTNISGTVFKARNLGIDCFSGSPGNLQEVTPTIIKQDYTPQTDSYYLTSVVEERDGVTTTTSYEYNGTNHIQPTKVTMINSDDEEYITQFEYIHDLSSGTLKDDLIDKNMLLPAISQIVSVNNFIVSGNKLEYSFYDSSLGVNITTPTSPNDHPYPRFYFDYEMTWNADGSTNVSGWDTIGTLLKIDVNNGFPAEFQQRGWEKETYVWNANNKIQSRTFKDFTWNYTYHANTKLVNTITDIDGQQVTYEYDDLMRLKKTSARSGNVTTELYVFLSSSHCS
ncbi:MAG: hypothetical protein AAFO07_20125 [Bacteroidota bacterium]